MLNSMEDTSVVQSILSQYRASLAMLRRAIDLCPDDLWLAAHYRNRTWHIVYHTLFYAHLYANASEAAFTPWDKHRVACRLLGKSAEEIAAIEPYSKAELLDYLQICSAAIEDRVPAVPLDAPSGFDWLPFNQLELHFYNIGHIQHHVGQLAERLRTVHDVGVPWVRNG
jgi:hypothetical protein